MKTIAVTAGAQWWYGKAAKAFTNRFNRLATYIEDGFECLDANDLLKEQWQRIKDHRFIKTYLWDVLPADVERIIWFDCDIFQTRPLHLAEIPDVPFAAALDTKWCDEKTREDWPEAESVVEFFNSGVMVCRRETRDIFEKVKVISERLIAGEEVPGNMGDQRWFNKYVAEKYKDFGTNPTGWHALPMEWNVINGRDRPLRPIFVHFAGIWDRWTLLDLLYKAADEAERFVVRR